MLLVRHSYGALNWEIPGGAGEAGESAEEAAIREVREETGVVVRAERLTGVYFERAARCHHFVFTCRLTSPDEPRPSSREITEVGWFARAEMPRPMSDFTLLRIDHALAGAPARVVEIGDRCWLG